MKKLMFVVLVMCGLMFCQTGGVNATVYSFTTSDLNFMDHGSFYEWGIEWTHTYDTIVSATLSVTGLSNSNILPGHIYDRIFVHVLDEYAASGSVQDLGTARRYLDANHSLIQDDFTLPPYSDSAIAAYMDSYGANWSYNFNAGDLAQLTGYASDGSFVIGLDSDCHYTASGWTLTIQTVPAPEPTTLFLLGSGLLGLGVLRRKQKVSK